MVRRSNCRHPREGSDAPRLTEEMLQGLRTARVRLTHRCNTDCSYCFIPYEQEPEVEDPAEVIRREVSRGAGLVVLTGGEPTLHPDLPALVRLARREGATVVGVQTNGLRLDDPGYIRALEEAGLSYLEISIPSHVREIYTSIVRSPRAYHRVMKAMENLVPMDLPLNVNHVVCPQNHRDVAEFARFMMQRFRLDVLTILVAAPFSPRQATAEHVVRYSAAAPFIRQALDLCLEEGMRFEGPWEKCGVPLCVLGHRRYFPGASPIPDGERSADFVDVPACARCSLAERCYRVRKLYVDVHGTDEFSPM